MLKDNIEIIAQAVGTLRVVYTPSCDHDNRSEFLEGKSCTR
jgi:hypothetical protein